jgi:hypothetical protein
MQSLALNDLCEPTERRPRWSTVFGKFFALNASMCMENRGHPLQHELEVDGDKDYTFVIERQEVSDEDKSFCADMQRTLEFGAYGMSALVIPEITKFTVIEVSKKGTGFDFWLGYIDDPLFQKKARLEVSGILTGGESSISRRASIKLKQISPTDASLLPGYVSIVEFGSFRMRIVRKILKKQ